MARAYGGFARFVIIALVSRGRKGGLIVCAPDRGSFFVLVFVIFLVNCARGGVGSGLDQTVISWESRGCERESEEGRDSQ
jgi:hypothetical protein